MVRQITRKRGPSLEHTKPIFKRHHEVSRPSNEPSQGLLDPTKATISREDAGITFAVLLGSREVDKLMSASMASKILVC